MSDSDPTSPLTIEVHGATRVFPGHVEAFRGVDLTVAYGESVAITGPSGCGKSTLLHLLAAIDTPTSGSVIVGGRDLGEIRDLGSYRRGEVGLVFQFHNLLPQLPAQLNVELPMFGTPPVGARAPNPRRHTPRRGRPRRLRGPPPDRVVGWGTPTCRDRPGAGERAEGSPRRRAHRQPRLGLDRALPPIAGSAGLCGDDHRDGDPRPRRRGTRRPDRDDARRSGGRRTALRGSGNSRPDRSGGPPVERVSVRCDPPGSRPSRTGGEDRDVGP